METDTPVRAVTAQEIAERRLARMRAGNGVAEVVNLVSDPEVRVALVPLMEREFMQVQANVGRMDAPENIAGLAMRDRQQSREIIVRALRQVNDYNKRLYETVDEMMDGLDVADVDMLIDEYNEMTEKYNPSSEGIPPEEFEYLKKVLNELDWSVLSGRQWYAAKRFLSAISPMLAQANLHGSGSTNS